MNYYYIEIRTCNGEISYPDNGINLFLDEYELNETFFQMTLGEFIISSCLKNKIGELIDKDCNFEKVNTVETRQDLEVLFSSIDDLEFWILKPRNDKDFNHIVWWQKRFLVVSQVLLNLLLSNNGYKDYISGSKFGKKWEVLTTRYFLSQPIDEYFNNQFKEDELFVQNKERANMDEYRRREGLPSLPFNE